MSDDPKTRQLIAGLRAQIEEDEVRLLGVRKFIADLIRKNPEAELSPFDRFTNLQLVDAVRKFLLEEAPDGATRDDIADVLINGGARKNRPNFDRDLDNSLIRSVRADILIKQGNRYFVGKKPPAKNINRNKKKPRE
jgi:hypothetical protein